MSDSIPPCPQCQSTYVYEDGTLFVCPECSFEWNPHEQKNSDKELESHELVVKDASGQVLVDGDSVVVIKDLKVKGAPKAIKVGTKVKNIHLVESNDGHNIACKVDGFGAMNLKSEFVRKM